MNDLVEQKCAVNQVIKINPWLLKKENLVLDIERSVQIISLSFSFQLCFQTVDFLENNLIDFPE